MQIFFNIFSEISEVKDNSIIIGVEGLDDSDIPLIVSMITHEVLEYAIIEELGEDNGYWWEDVICNMEEWCGQFIP